MARRLLALTAGVMLVASGCREQTDHSSSATATSTARPASTAVLDIVSPAAGATVTGSELKVEVSLQGAHVLGSTTTKLRPDEGHVHLSLDGQLQQMSYGLEQTVPVTPGNHVLQAEFVAGDHAPFFPRVIAVKRFSVR